MTPPRDDHPLHGPWPGPDCHLCHRPLSMPMAKASSTPLMLIWTSGSPLTQQPRSPHCHEPLGDVSHTSRRWLLESMTKTSILPSRLSRPTGSDTRFPPPPR